MDTEHRAWLDTMRRAMCASSPWAEQHFCFVAGEVYPHLVATGYDVPLCVVADIACLYLDEEACKFEPRSDCPTHTTLVGRYCDLLNADVQSDAFRNARRAVRRALRQSRLARDAHLQRLGRDALPNGNGADHSGLATFLGIVVSGLPDADGATPPWRTTELLARCRAIAPLLDSPGGNGASNRHAEAAGCIDSFLKRLLDAKWDPRWGPLSSSLNGDPRTLLAVAGAHSDAGADGTDLRVLQSALGYDPIDPPDELMARYRHLRRALVPQQSQNKRALEAGGYHGVARKGAPSSVLRSYLAREDFVARYYQNALLYYDRHAIQEEPHRVLLAWVIDRGRLMRQRTPAGERLDSVARRLAARTIEDAARYYHDIPALEINMVVLMHNGEAHDALFRPVAADAEWLSRAPSAGRDGDCEAWLPKVDGFMPHFFAREPVWMPAPIRRTGSVGTPAPNSRPYLAALAGLLREAGVLGSATAAASGSRAYQLCYVSMLGPEPSLPEGAKDRAEAARYLCSLCADKAVLRTIACGPEAVEWRAGAGETVSEPCGEAFGPGSAIRHAVWRDLLDRLHEL